MRNSVERAVLELGYISVFMTWFYALYFSGHYKDCRALVNAWFGLKDYRLEGTIQFANGDGKRSCWTNYVGT